MRNLLLKILAFLVVFSLSSCAASYKIIDPPAIYYNAQVVNEGITFSYKYDVLSERGNRKYALKESKKDIKILAVSLTNNTESEINIGSDLVFYAGDRPLFPLDATSIMSNIKQHPAGYLPYLLLTLLQLSITTNSGTDYYPVGLILGPGITLGNVLVASSANDNLARELIMYNIQDKVILPGETIYGIMGFHKLGYEPITVRFR